MFFRIMDVLSEIVDVCVMNVECILYNIIPSL